MRKLDLPENFDEVARQYQACELTLVEGAKLLGFSANTFKRRLNDRGIPTDAGRRATYHVVLTSGMNQDSIKRVLSQYCANAISSRTACDILRISPYQLGRLVVDLGVARVELCNEAKFRRESETAVRDINRTIKRIGRM